MGTGVSGRIDMRDQVRDEERRRRDEAKIIALQQQLDEMRSLVREVVARQSRNEEGFKQYELALAQLRTSTEQHRHEVSQTLQARSLEDSRVRQQLTELDGRIEDTGRPIRSLQAHISEILETLRRGRDETDDEQRKYDELKSIIEHIAAVAERNTGVTQVTRESIEGLRTDLETLRRELLLAEDSVKILEQEVRRRSAEVTQDTRNLSLRIDEFKAVFDQLQGQIEDVRASIVHIDPALEQLAEIDGALKVEIERYVIQADERDDLLSERIDEIRRQIDVQVRDLRQIAEQRYEHVNQRVDSQIDVDRELTYRLNLIDMRIEEVRELWTKLRREVWHIHEQRSRMHLDQAQAELEAVTDARRAAEMEATPERNGGGS
jgi:predicted nuclease with TOPRIM domain